MSLLENNNSHQIRRRGHQFLMVLCFGIFMVAYQNCGVQKPKVEEMSMMSVGFSHSPIPASCVDCHNSARPAGSKTLSPDGISNLFFHGMAYNGDADCVLCHTQNQASVGVTWASGIFNHKSNQGTTISTCNECHTGNMPKVPVGMTNFDHKTIGTDQCIKCHQNVGANWSTTAFSHSPLPTSCSSCHESNRPAPTVYFPSNPAQPTLNLYVHASQYNGSSDCLNCHTAVPANAGVTWSGATFNHKNTSNATVSDCMNCHAGSRPSNHLSLGYTGDCVQCHTNAGVDWSAKVPANVTYPSPTTVAWGTITTVHPSLNSQTGMSCTSCHANYNSTFSIKGFDHSAMPAGTRCVSCHVTGQQVVATTTLPNFKTVPASHRGGVSYSKDCVSCHFPGATGDLVQFQYPTWNATTKSFTGGMWK